MGLSIGFAIDPGVQPAELHTLGRELVSAPDFHARHVLLRRGAHAGIIISHMTKRVFLPILAAFALTTAASAQSKLTLKVHTGAGVNGYDVNSTMISGEKDMLVIDPQFSLSEAHRLAAEILESNEKRSR
jgi:hypothetical protein